MGGRAVVVGGACVGGLVEFDDGTRGVACCEDIVVTTKAVAEDRTGFAAVHVAVAFAMQRVVGKPVDTVFGFGLQDFVPLGHPHIALRFMFGHFIGNKTRPSNALLAT